MVDEEEESPAPSSSLLEMPFTCGQLQQPAMPTPTPEPQQPAAKSIPHLKPYVLIQKQGRSAESTSLNSTSKCFASSNSESAELLPVAAALQQSFANNKKDVETPPSSPHLPVAEMSRLLVKLTHLQHIDIIQTINCHSLNKLEEEQNIDT